MPLIIYSELQRKYMGNLFQEILNISTRIRTKYQNDQTIRYANNSMRSILPIDLQMQERM